MGGADKSLAWVERLRAVMPFGSSTCSKRAEHLPEAPGVIVRGDGCRVWDADGRPFIDFRNALGPVTLGYRFPAVDAAIREQLESGILFGHPHPLECEVAEMLCEVIPCAEQARFLKTGGEAVAACIRLARYCTGREHVIHVGYNGWLNALASGGRILPRQTSRSAPPGVPGALSALHHAVPWGDVGALEELFTVLPEQVAAVVVARSCADLGEGASFYPALRRLTSQSGGLLVFDEIVTGFRIAVGGAQEYFGVTPDLCVFGKGVANGMPLSVYAGRREWMSRFDRVIVSVTHAGEALSLAAAKAAIRTYRERDVVGHLWRQGERMWTGLNGLFERHGIGARLAGFWPCPQMTFDESTVRDRFFRAAYGNGVSLYDVPYVNFSHQDADIAEALERLETACREM